MMNVSVKVLPAGVVIDEDAALISDEGDILLTIDEEDSRVVMRLGPETAVQVGQYVAKAGRKGIRMRNRFERRPAEDI